jgi:hypothetical protein
MIYGTSNHESCIQLYSFMIIILDTFLYAVFTLFTMTESKENNYNLLEQTKKHLYFNLLKKFTKILQYFE